MHKQMKLITTAGILGLFLVWNYAFELLAKLGAGIFSAVLTGQLTAEAMNNELYSAIAQQALPFLLMMVIGSALFQWSKGKSKALAATDSQWSESAAQRKATDLAIVGGLVAFAGLYNLFVPIYFGFSDLIAGLSSPESAGYVLKAVLPNYVVLLVQMALGIWMVVGTKTADTPAEAGLPIDAVTVTAEDVDAEDAVDADAPAVLAEEAAPVAEAAAEVTVIDEEVNKVQ